MRILIHKDFNGNDHERQKYPSKFEYKRENRKKGSKT